MPIRSEQTPFLAGSVGSPWSDLKTLFLPQEEMQDMEHQYPSAEPSESSPIPPQKSGKSHGLGGHGLHLSAGLSLYR